MSYVMNIKYSDIFFTCVYSAARHLLGHIQDAHIISNIVQYLPAWWENANYQYIVHKAVIVMNWNKKTNDQSH
jgi:hypothetical protein